MFCLEKRRNAARGFFLLERLACLAKSLDIGYSGSSKQVSIRFMKVILLEDVKGLGKALDVKEVKNGYGFNYLLPEGLADLATPGALKQAERFVARRQAEVTKSTEEHRALADMISGKKVVIKSKAEKGKLFGSVGREEVAAALEGMGIKVDKQVVVLEKAIKEVGAFALTAQFGHGVKASFELVIESE